jgi:hypothetical protein
MTTIDNFTEGPIDPRIINELATDMWRVTVSYLPVKDVLKLPNLCKYLNEEIVWHKHSGRLLWGEMNLEELLFAERPIFPPCRTVLIRACEKDAPLSHIMCLINGRANVNAVDEDDDVLNNGGGHTALLFASIRGNENTVRALLKANADPNLHNYIGSTPLMLAQNEGVLLALLEGGADPNQVTDFLGETALRRKISYTYHFRREERLLQLENMVRLLINAKADVSQTVLERALSSKCSDIILYILEQAQLKQEQLKQSQK